MANNDLDIYGGGDLAPYSPSQPLAPAPDFSNSEIDLLRDSTENYTGGGQMILGQPLPPGVTIKQAVEHYQALGNVFAQDFMKLGHNISQTQKAVKWFTQALKNPPAQQRPYHQYMLYEHSNDPIFQAFANYAHDNGFSQKFLSDACWWVTEISKRLNAQQPLGAQGQVTAQGRAPLNSTKAMLNSLSDADYEKVIKINEQARAKTMQQLAAKYGEYSVQQVVEIAQRHLESLPANERAHFDQFTTGWVHSLNSFQILDALYGMAINVNSIGNVAQEIAQFEAMLKIPSERAKYQRDPVLQARLRELYRRRG